MRNRLLLTSLTLIASAMVFTGCERRPYYRTQADAEVNCIIQQNSQDPRWALSGVSVTMDSRSRYYDTFDPDHPPQPVDDPESAKFMQCVDGMRGYPFWDIDGQTDQFENPGWRDQLAEYVPINDNGEIVLDRESALRLAYVNNTGYQGQLETLYLSALDVSTERFRLDSQFFGGTSTRYDHLGQLNAFGERNTLNQDLDLAYSRRFATAGTLLVNFANSFVFNFAGANTNNAVSLFSFNFIQPLLANGGRVIALEQLTIVERALLNNLRSFQRFRQGFYTQTVIGNLGVGSLQRRGGFFGGTGLSGFTGTGAGGIGGVGGGTFGFGGGGGGGVGGAAGGTGLAGGGAGRVGGFIGLLQTLQELRNAQDAFNLQIRTLSVLEAYLDAGQIDLVQVDQFRQSIETQRAQLLQAEIGLQNSIEGYLTGTLSLPPNLPVQLDDTLIRPFQLVADEFTALQNSFNIIQDTIASYVDAPDRTMDRETLGGIISESESRRQAVEEYLNVIRDELVLLKENSDERKRFMTPDEQRQFDVEVAKLTDDLDSLLMLAADATPELEAIAAVLMDDNVLETQDRLLVWLRDFQFFMQEVVLLQARIRVESILIDPIQLDPDLALQIALFYREDVMNNRASIVDTWRLIAFNANRLMSDLTVQFDGDVSTTGNNPLKFQGPTGSLTARLEYDAPFTRLLERNNYRQALIDYHRSRRQFVQFIDGVNSTLRATLRNLEQLRLNLEIQRRAVIIAIRRVDATQQQLNEPLPVPVPGQPAPQRGPTDAQNLNSALEDLRNTQNNFMSVWLNYYATRMALLRDLGIMQIDDNGEWIDQPVDFYQLIPSSEEIELPPALPEEWLREAFPDEVPLEPGDAPIPEAGEFAPLPEANDSAFEGPSNDRTTRRSRMQLPISPVASLGGPNWQPALPAIPTEEAVAEPAPEPESSGPIEMIARPFRSLFGQGKDKEEPPTYQASRTRPQY